MARIYENVDVNKKLVLRGVGNPIVDAGGSGSYNNTALYNDDGIFMFGYCNNNTLYNNTVNSNMEYGIYLSWHSSNNSLSNNNISNNLEGIKLWGSSNNKIYFNNFINNINVDSSGSTNIWNSTEKITYTYKGNQYTNYLGNYWSDYTGTDANEDGIGDTAYSIDGDKDNYPLMDTLENYFPEENKPPIAQFTYSPESPIVNQTITFNASSSYDPDGNITSYKWDFGDNTTGTGVAPAHIYTASGTYTVSLIVTDNDGEPSTTTVKITVLSGVKGDFNGNGRVDIGDATYVAYMVVGDLNPRYARVY